MDHGAKRGWVPPHRIREHARARRVTLRMVPGSGLQVTVPRGFDRALLADVFERHREWIERQLAATREESRRHPRDLLPAAIELTAAAEIWPLTITHLPDTRLRLTWARQPRPRIDLAGDLGDGDAGRRLLQQWLKAQGRRILIPLVEQRCRETGLGVKRCQVRIQKTRWGSYSTQGTLSLNAGLLFLSRSLVRHVITHELCHTLHFGHPPAFWRELARWEPDWRRLDAELKNSTSNIPEWVRV
ncbi:MAG: hypothetical protein COT06_00035 [Syntrophobacteraceae bacterium CG07_land_8_20_14_0_80_61_8]|nr:MAG: hypothetical protein COT06_00035 [Syntrophobacteraceae bacterium CG07_land_8_20_14_0_80_61_8]